MTGWQIRYFVEKDGSCPVQDWLDGLSKDQFKLIAKKLILLEKCGNVLKMPHSKSLKQGLFELRETSFGLRIYYCFSGNKIIILLLAADKKTQAKDIKRARSLVLKIEEKVKL